jgi:hypothetical protein
MERERKKRKPFEKSGKLFLGAGGLSAAAVELVGGGFG